MDLKYFEAAELSTIEVCKDTGHFSVEAWLSEDTQAGHSFKKKLGTGKCLHYIAGMLQWGKVYGKETSYRGMYYMLSKDFIEADTPRGTFLSGMATILDRSSKEEEGMYLIHLYEGEDLQWPFRVSSQKAIAIPLAYHDVTYVDLSSLKGGWQKYHSRCFHILLQVSKDDAVILPSQLTGIPNLVKAEFKTRCQYGSCCMLFRSGEPSHLIPLGMTSIAVPGLPEPWSQAFSAHAMAVAGGLKWSAVSLASASESQMSDCSTVRWMFSSTRDSLDQVAVSSAVHEGPGIPVDFEVQQPKSRSAKKRRISGGQGGVQTTVDQAGPAVALSHV